MLQSREEEREVEGQNDNRSEKNNMFVQGAMKQEAPRTESRMQGTVKALYFLAYHTGAIYRDNDNSESESEGEFENNK